MKQIIRHIYAAIAVIAVVLLHSGCMDNIEEVDYSPTETVSFKTSLAGGEVSLSTKGMAGSLEFEEEDWILDLDEVTGTKAVLINSLNGLKAGVYGYVYSGDWTDQNTPLEVIDGAEYAFDGDQLKTDKPVRWSVVETGKDKSNTNFRAFVYAPIDAVVPELQIPATDADPAKGAPVIGVDVRELQKDIIVSDGKVAMDLSNGHRKEIPLVFDHIFTAIHFKAGFDCTIKSVIISNVAVAGEYVIGAENEWRLNDRLENYSLALPEEGISVEKGHNIGDPILMLPQIFGSGSTISLVYVDAESEEHTVTAELNGVEWKQGKKITYTLMREEDRKYIYLDLAAGNVKITSDVYEGYVFVMTDDVVAAKLIKGKNDDGKKYYIYQSCVTDYIKNHSEEKFKKNYKSCFSSYKDEGDYKYASGTFTLPSYEQVIASDGRLWSDYITNNDNVEAVIEAWDDSDGANRNVFNSDKAVRKVGREATKNTIHVSGSVGECTVIVDNVYCSYTSDKSGNRDIGSVTFVPTPKSGSKLTLHLVGDNRLGSIQYNNRTRASVESNRNYLVIEGEGSLTVADSDFKKSQGFDAASGGVYGYYSNHYDSAIGNADNKDDCYGIVINSGTVYAGTTAAENCTAIGGGGNGVGEVIINGGVVTAVASTTGTAIGGGIGYSASGGEGLVTITGGNVYAYNKANPYKIPSSAIGGAGSSAARGTIGTVVITGGNIYAESGLGTAIGGGSSKTRPGGKGVVTISGGYVVAKSNDSNSAGIGGGSSYTGSYTSGQNTNNGGDAEITISGNSILRTGSIGGGSPGKGANNGGKIGSAIIKVRGGDVQAQFVMADSKNNVFEMTGGVVRNSSTSDNEYFCIQPNGGAVYMEKGTFTMSGGVIKECYADKTESAKGGAVYIKGDSNTSFTMTGGEIRECRANADGGAVYLEGGNVTISGGTIDGNVAYNGNGGAISVLGGSFTMDGKDVKIAGNAAFDRGSGLYGNGGGIYVAPTQNSTQVIDVSLIKGSVSANSSDRNGGGVCVDMGNNDSARLNVVVGEEKEGTATDLLAVWSNNALMKGGGMYVSGANATVTLNDGYILNNETSSYQVNPDMAVEGGLVTLMKPGITTQVTVTFNNNAQYYTQNIEDTVLEQYVVASSQNRLNPNVFSAINDYYKNFKGWNTRRDGNGTSYTDEQIVSLNENVTLYAQWSN